MEAVFSAALLLISVIYVYLAVQIPFGSMGNPGPGFLPVAAGSFAAALSLIAFIASPQKKAIKFPDIKLVQGFLPFVLGLLVFTPLLKPLGYDKASFLLGIYLFKVTGINGWLRPVGYAAIVTLVFHLIFVTWLKTALP